MQLGLRSHDPLDYQVDSVCGWVMPVVQVSCRGRDVVGPAYVGNRQIPGLANIFFCKKIYRASRELARVGFLYLRFLTIQLQQAHPPSTPTNFIESPWLAIWIKSCEEWRFRKLESPPFDQATRLPLKNRYQLVLWAINVWGWFREKSRTSLFQHVHAWCSPFQ